MWNVWLTTRTSPIASSRLSWLRPPRAQTQQHPESAVSDAQLLSEKYKTQKSQIQSAISHKHKTHTHTSTGQLLAWHTTLIKRTANVGYFLLDGKASLVSIQFSDGTEAHTDMHCKSKIIKVGITFTFAPSEWSELTEALRQAASDKDLEFRHLAFPDYQQGVPKVSARVFMQ